jgi:hypothetical protein
LLSFATPLWLVGLLLVPVIRWLHRRGPNLRSVPVSSLGLWQRAAASSSVAGEHRPPDPAWRRRALLTALLFVVLSGPQMREERSRITIWVDDSLSMLSLEIRATRLVEGLAQVRSALADAPIAEVEVRTLGDPWRRLGALTEASVATIVAGAGQKEPGAPPAALLRRDSVHWLLTDGADAALLDWPGSKRPDRTFQLARVTRNVGLERLSARRNLNDPERYDLLLKVTNGGTATEARGVVFATDAGEFARSSHRLEPGAFALVTASMPASASVRAMLQPADALAADDEIVLDLGALRRRRVSADPDCPPALLAAVRAHPALSLVEQESTAVEVVLDCGTRAAVHDVATIRVLAHRVPTRPSAPLQWSSSVPGSGRIRLDAEFLQVAARLKPRPVDTVLLAAGDEPLIVARAGAPAVLETVLDFGSVVAAGRPEIPLLVDFLFERVLGGDLLDELAMVDRGPTAVRVAPIERVGVDFDRSAPSETRARDVARPFLVAALLVLLWEIVALVRQSHRLRDPETIVSA